jgi:hypothetical protein
MQIITKRIHIWRLALPLYFCGEFIKWGQSYCKYSFILFGHKICIYNKSRR